MGKEIKSLIQFCKCASKEAMNATMTMYVEKGCSKVLFSYSDMRCNATKERYFCLNTPANMTVRIGISGEHLAMLAKDWSGGMWIVDPSRAVILDYSNDATGLIMPKMIDNSLVPENGECNIKPLERNRQTDLETMEDALEAEPVNAVSAEESIDLAVEIHESKGKPKESGDNPINPVNNPVEESGMNNNGVSNTCKQTASYISEIRWIWPIRSAVGSRDSVGSARILRIKLRHKVRIAKNGIHRIRDGTMKSWYTFWHVWHISWYINTDY